MTFKSMQLLMVLGLLLIEFWKVQGAVASQEPRVIVYREVGEDGYPTEHKTLTVWGYPKPTNLPQENDNPPEPVHQEEQLIPEVEHRETPDDIHVIEDNQPMTATEEPDPELSQIIPEETPISTVIDAPEEEAVVDPIDDQPMITSVVTETIFSTKTVSGTSITTTTMTTGAKSDSVQSQNSLTSTFSISKDDLLFRANRGQRHDTDSILCIMMAIAVVLGVL